MIPSIAAVGRATLVALMVGVVVGACASPVATAPASPEPTPSATPGSTTEPTVQPPLEAGPFPESLVGGLRTETDVPFTALVECGAGECEVPLDILAPEDGEALPTIVLLPGGPSGFADRRYLELLASGLAQRDAVVFVATYRSQATGDSAGDSLDDARCAVRYARLRSSEFGGDPARLVLVGHSFAGGLAIATGANAEQDTPGCLADEDGTPSAAVALAGFQFAVVEPVEAGPTFLLMSGSEDQAARTGEASAAELREAGFAAEYAELEGIDHFEIVDGESAPEVIDSILALADPAGD